MVAESQVRSFVWKDAMSCCMADLDECDFTGKVIILDNKTGGVTVARIQLSSEQSAAIREVWSQLPGISCGLGHAGDDGKLGSAHAS
jgi:hypothetical protein